MQDPWDWNHDLGQLTCTTSVRVTVLKSQMKGHKETRDKRLGRGIKRDKSTQRLKYKFMNLTPVTV